MSKPETKDLRLDLIRISGGTQPRAKIDLDLVDEYATAFENGDDMPAIDVFFDGTDYWLADGFHRYHGGKKLGLITIAAKIHHGTLRDAILFSVGANAAHGLRRSSEDKRNAVMKLLQDAEWSKWSARMIADKCGVSNNFVSELRPKTMSSDDVVSKVQFVTKTGKVAERTVTPKPKATPTPKPTPQPATAPLEYAPFTGVPAPLDADEDAVDGEQDHSPEPALAPPTPAATEFNWLDERSRILRICRELIDRCPDYHREDLSYVFQALSQEVL